MLFGTKFCCFAESEVKLNDIYSKYRVQCIDNSLYEILQFAES